MEVNHTVSLLGFDDKDRTIFTSLLGLLFIKTGESWLVDSAGNSDLVVVDMDNFHSDEVFALDLNGRRVIHCGRQRSIHSDNTLWLQKPLKASNIMSCLQQVISSEIYVIENKDLALAKVDFYQLTSWPEKELLMSFPGCSRLSALLIHASVTIVQAVEMTGIAYSDIERFIQDCADQGIILVQQKTTNQPSIQSELPSIQHLSLFAQLRGRFCCRG